MMLVPAMAFAWCVVSMSTPPPPRHIAGSVRRTHEPMQASAESPAAEADTATEQQGAEDPSVPTELTEAQAPSEERDTEGRRVPVKLVTPAIVRVARTFLDLPMGAERSVEVDGRRYVFVLERHYHPPGFVGGPVGYHKGVTVYEFR
jgi:hypothetical protein